MPDIGSLNIGGPAYIALKSKSDGWLPSGENISSTLGLPLHDSEDKIGPPELRHYGSTRAISLGISRDYDGIGSSGGPLVSGRSDHGDFLIEQSANSASSTIFQHCCSGEQFAWVHLVLLGQSLDLSVDSSVPSVSQKIHIRITDTNISGFDFSGGRYFGDQFSSFTGQSIQESTSLVRGGKLLGVSHVVKYKLWYTAVSFEVGGVERGWHTGEDVAWPP